MHTQTVQDISTRTDASIVYEILLRRGQEVARRCEPGDRAWTLDPEYVALVCQWDYVYANRPAEAW